MGIVNPSTANLAQSMYFSKKNPPPQAPSGQAGMNTPNTTPLGGKPGGIPK